MIGPKENANEKFWKKELNWQDYQRLKAVQKSEWLKKWFGKPATMGEIAEYIEKIKKENHENSKL